ncbi:MAG: rod shape-determining protein MreC [Myxococcota bacterium]
MTDLLRRFRYPLTYAVLAAVCATTLARQEAPTDLGIGQRLVLDAAVPLERMVVLPIAAIRDVWNNYVALVGARSESRRLREELQRLRDENLQYREAIVASERFGRLADSRAAHETPMVPANVISHALSPWFRSIVIDQGRAAGVEPGMAVITDEGVVGVISGTTRGASRVLLITDPQSRLNAFVQRTRARGSVRGRSVPNCDFDYVARGADVRPGDLLVTSGLDSLYPKGLMVGRIRSVDRQPYGLFQRADLAPAVDFQTVEEVFVLLNRRQLPDPAELDRSVEALWPAAGERPPGAASRAAD